MEPVVGGVAAAFALMGSFALVWPERVVAFFGTTALSVDGRNEVRAVYGGFGLAMAAALLWGLLSPHLAPGVFFAAGLALWGMAAGRVISVLIERSAGFYPWLFFGIELVGGGALLLAGLRAP